jgi:hypothetical protein
MRLKRAGPDPGRPNANEEAGERSARAAGAVVWGRGGGGVGGEGRSERWLR